MADSEEQLSPEEKLLKVIRGGEGDEGQKAAPGEETDVVGEPAVKPGPAMVAELAEEKKRAAASATGGDKPPASASDKKQASPAQKEEAAPADKNEKKGAGQAAKSASSKAEPPPAAERKGKTKAGRNKGKKKARPGKTPEPAVVGGGGAVMTGVPDKRGSRPLGIRTVNRCLVGVVILLILFAVLEIHANLQSASAATTVAVQAPVAPLDFGTEGQEQELPELKIVLQEWADNPIVRLRDEPATVRQQASGQQKPPETPLSVYVEENLNLIGLSLTGGPGGTEAIVVDNKTGKMHFLKVGDKIQAGNHELELVNIQGEKARFSGGNEELTIE